MKRALAVALISSTTAVSPAPSGRTAPSARPTLGLAVELSAATAAEDRTRILDELRRTGVSMFLLSVSWSRGEPARGVYRVEEVLRTARLLRQSGALLHLDLPLVETTARDVPRDLADVAFDDPKLSLRLGRFLDALRPALLDVSTLSLGREADVFFAGKPDELRAYRRLFDGAVEYLSRTAPNVRVGVTTSAPMESAAPTVAAALHQKSPVLFYTYGALARDAPYRHRPPGSIEADWKALLTSAAGRPIAFPEVSYSSASENGSSPEAQAEFVRRFRRFLAAADGSALLFARYAVWRDPPPEAASAASDFARVRDAFYAHRGLQTVNGAAKPAWREWLKAR